MHDVVLYCVDRSLYSFNEILQLVLDNHFPIYSFFQPSSTARTWLDELRCSGIENRLIDCPANPIGVEDCSHTQDVALVCNAGT